MMHAAATRPSGPDHAALLANAFLRSLSLAFPYGERYFIEAVRRYEAEAPPPLAAEIQKFKRQEAAHSQAHLAYNDTEIPLSPELKELMVWTRRGLTGGRLLPPPIQVGVTAALEHVTAVLAHEWMTDPVYLEHESPRARQLWMWHGREEIEHKAVAFDIYMLAAREWRPVTRWWRRSGLLFRAGRILLTVAVRGMTAMLVEAGVPRPAARREVLWYLFARPGNVRRRFWRYAAYLRPGFHPWDVDDSALCKPSPPPERVATDQAALM